MHADLDAKISRVLAGADGGYVAFLQATARVLLPLESALEAAGVSAMLPDWRKRARSDALRADLNSLAVQIPKCESLVLPGRESHIFGILYVLEGSRLGAKQIVRIVAEHPRVRFATLYLSHGAGLSLWQSYLMHLEQSDMTRRQPADALRGAEMAFMLFDAAVDNYFKKTAADV